MRDPSIHIKESDLKKIFEGFVERGDDPKYWIDLAEEVIRKSKKYTCNNRAVTITNDKLDKKITKILKMSSTDTHTFNNILFMVRKKNKHFGFKKVEEGSNKEWGMIKEASSLALDFCNEFGLDRKIGFTKYCEIAISKMQKFSYPKLKSMYDGICQTYHFQNEVSMDKLPDTTRAIHDFYCQIISRQTGTGIDYSNQPENYYYFIAVRQECERKGVKYQDYIRAQFDAMGFRHGIPHPAQLVGEKANERLTTYLFENQKHANKVEDTERKKSLASLKKLK